MKSQSDAIQTFDNSYRSSKMSNTQLLNLMDCTQVGCFGFGSGKYMVKHIIRRAFVTLNSLGDVIINGYDGFQ